MTKTRIGIIGGGLAGLMTAYTLSKENHSENQPMEITLFEATSHVGGRIYTLRDFSSGLYAEAGAMTFTDNEPEILELINELKLKIVDRSIRSEKKYYTAGEHISWLNSQQNHYFKKYILNNISSRAYNLYSKEALQLDHLSMYDFIQQKVSAHNQKIPIEEKNKLDDVKHVMHALETSILGLYCDNFTKLSALHGLRWVSQYLDAKKSFSIS